MTQTLEGFESVTAVEFRPAREEFEVSYKSDSPMGDGFRQAVTDIIVFPGVRSFLGGLGDTLNNSKDTGP